ncbi:pyruvate carboxylase [Tautonia plasticadhaerens]|uniref:Pyruvate carboxylase n=1 Tax=Tautonia plasticadhaerens TaxID=2527974 RepID=A0A518GXN7_9BACT|nr:pyruvate carboxylase [Tautonia plasticadhaerens]QDV33351.1 2-oxoglutarate carboxylase small subunit [Tautonia plasticadhaerens]
MPEFRKLLVANRGEIAIRVFRSAHELGLRTVAIYSHEDRFAMHRLKADEAYRVGKQGEPIRSYLGIENIIELAVDKQVDAIHPGYGFLSENAAFARACREAGITWVGPRPELLDMLGDKVAARKLAVEAGVPVLGGTAEPVEPGEGARAKAEEMGYPVIVKASMGGGGRGMRVVESPEKLDDALDQARREAQTAFGCPDVFLEKFITQAKHIEVQLLGDQHGNLVHLYERDCSVQRRHQKIIEIAPAASLDPGLRRAICDAAIKLGSHCRYDNAGTVEFLVDAESGRFYFIEVNPRIQVEHTVTEMITGIDLIKSQILIASGTPLSDPEIGLPDQSSVQVNGHAFQCRITTEDPENNFTPDYGRITHYRSPGGMGLRLDSGTAITGAIVTPFYDSMLVKVSAQGRRFIDAVNRMKRALDEFRVRGVKTNIPFLLNVIDHPDFAAGRCTTRFIDQTPDLFRFPKRLDRASRLLGFAADVAVNGFPGVTRPPGYVPPPEPEPPASPHGSPIPEGSRDRLKQLGPEKFASWVREQTQLLLTDTTFRDAHQSLLATRMRTREMLRVAESYARLCPELFSIEMWGGATFDTSMRFLKEDPWERLSRLREAIPNILFQMLLRGSNAVGYTSYPDNVVRAFVKEAADAGIDLFRVFDSLNWVPNMEVSIEAIRESGALCEAAICYTGDILDPGRTKYDLKYYVSMARELEKRGANLIAIKDMAGLCKPYAAERLVKALREEVGLPIHFHTHDIGGAQAASVLKGAEVGLDVADGAVASMSALTSQPSLNALVESLRFTPRETGLDPARLIEMSRYWEAARSLYSPFETGQKAPSAEVYAYEMPGGQYTNLYQQAKALGLDDRWPEVCAMYAQVNLMFGDIVKVTPSSKVVGDMALFMVANNLAPDDVLDESRELAFPESVVEFVEGRLGQPPGGFPPALQARILKGRPALTDRPGKDLPPADLDAARAKAAELLGHEATPRDALSLLLYPRVFPDLASHLRSFSDTSVLPTTVFFFGPEVGSEHPIEIEPGKTLIVKLLAIGEPHVDGTRTAFFELNGQPREVIVADRSLASAVKQAPKADPGDPNQVASPLPGLVVGVAVSPGDPVRKGQKLLSIEAMKMETTLYAERPGRVAEVLAAVGLQVQTGDLLVRMTDA